jgi:hypothetical protein
VFFDLGNPEEFAACYHIPLGTLRDRQQGRTEPEQPARAYLRVIAHDAEGVRRALAAKPDICRVGKRSVTRRC